MDNNQMFDANNQQPEYNSTYTAQPQYAYAAPAQPQKKSNKIGFAIASLVLGLLSILSCCILIGAVFGIPGLIVGIIPLVKKYDGKGMAIAGVITSVIGIIICVITSIVAYREFSEFTKYSGIWY